MKRSVFWLFACVLFVSALTVAADKGPAADSMPLARMIPRGAIAYVQARNLADLFGRWRKSPAHDRYYNSDNFKAFQQSRLFAKLSERLKEFEDGAGIQMDETRIAEMAGGATAVAMYDMGKLEIVYVTELPAAKASLTALFKQSAKFEERKAGNNPYFVLELATDGGRMRQGLSFASVDGKFIVSTTETLMQRTLGNLAAESADRLSDDIAPTLAVADGFQAHDVTLWTDLPRLKAQRFFKLYWIQGKAAAGLDGISATLADLDLSADGILERRWSLYDETARKSVKPAETRNPIDFLKLATGSQFLDGESLDSATGEAKAASAVMQTLFPAVRPTAAPSDPPSITTGGDSRGANGERYADLDERFDRDIDDPSLAVGNAKDKAKTAAPTVDPLETELAGILKAAGPTLVARLGSAKTDAATKYVTFDRAVILEFKNGIDAKKYEAVISEMIFRRYLVAGTLRGIEWRTNDKGITAPNIGGIAEQGGAYFIDGKRLVIANSVAFAESLKTRMIAAAPLPESGELKRVTRLASFHLKSSGVSFRNLMKNVDYTFSEGLEGIGDEAEGGDQNVSFFGQNIASLLTVASEFDQITLEAVRGEKALTEAVTYRYGTPANAVRQPRPGE
jgi:hypothetical protein